MENRGSVIVALFLISMGVIFLVATFVPGAGIIAIVWPVFVILPGLIMLSLGMTPSGGMERARAAGFLIPGTIVTTIGLILFATSVTGHWEAWWYAWALIPASTGLGLWLAARRGGWVSVVPVVEVVARWMVWSGVLVFLVLAIIFEGFIYRGLGALFAAIVLITLGILFLIGGRWWQRFVPWSSNQ